MLKVFYSYIKKLNLKLKKIFYSKGKPKEFIPYDWKKSNYNRIALINAVFCNLDFLNAKYLEIGCDKNYCFCSISALNKVGVDPLSGGTKRMTSNEFFAQNKELFDVILVDGLHSFVQSRRDAINALNCLKVGGYIFFHDFIPRDWKEEHVPRLQADWTGDVWKTAFELFETGGIKFFIVECDHGVGVVKKVEDAVDYPDLYNQLKDRGFEYFYEHYKELPIVDPAIAIKSIVNNKF